MKYFVFVFSLLTPILSPAQLIPDSSFGTDGRIYYGLPDAQYTRCLDIKINKDNSVIGLMAGYQGNTYSISLVKFQADGQIDENFGYQGIMPLPVYGNDLKSGKLHLDSQGRIYTWGWGVSYVSVNPPRTNWLKRFEPDGSADTSFHPLEDLMVQRPYLKNSCVTFYRRPDGKYYVNGGYYESLWRFQSNNTPDSSFGKLGRTDSLCNCADGIFEGPGGSVNMTGQVYSGNYCAIFIMDKNGKKDLMRTMKGWLVTDCGIAANLAPEKYAVQNIRYGTDYSVQLHIRLFRDAFSFPAGFGNNGKVSTSIDSACIGVATGAIMYKKKWLMALWNRYEVDDNNYYVRYRGGISIFDSTGKIVPWLNRNGNPYLLPEEKNNHALAALDIYESGSILAGMNIWNSGSYAALLVKLRMPDLTYEPAAGISDPAPWVCRVFPNPSEGLLHIGIPEGNKIRSVLLTDLNGRNICGEPSRESDHLWQIQVHSKGWCLVKVESETGKTAMFRIFIQ